MSKIVFDGISKVYTGAAQPAVDQLSLEVPEGSFAVLLGPSGCGKTTLLKMVNRLVEPTAGAIYLDDVDSREMDVTLLRRQIGYVIQQIGLFPHMTVAQNVAVVPQLLGWTKERIAARTDELLELVGLPPGEFRGRYPAQLSGGQQQRVGLARALAVDPKVLLMDEPFGALDAINRTNLQREMLRLQQRLHKTILFVTHDVEEALTLADELVIMRQGRLVQAGIPCELLSEPANDFVRELLNADDRVRQISFVKLETAMRPLPDGPLPADAPTLDIHETVRRALSLLLSDGVEQVIVTKGGAPQGLVTFEDLKDVRCTDEQP
jgi:osmoprotectant transport system ATP-binding protein